jgi:trans-2,3-dihydro-3-hydroxyanthranilate isomerase
VASHPYVVLDVFTETPLEGNPLAVFLDGDAVPAERMQSIAAEFNLSETVFVVRAADAAARARLRIFTPRRELPFAGHPTIGAAVALAEHDPALQDRFAFEEGVGLVPIERDSAAGAGRFWLTTPAISFYETVPRADAARLLGLSEDELLPIEPRFISAGSPLLCIALRDRDAVDRAAIDASLLELALGSVNSVATFIFAPNPGDDGARRFDVYSRMFAPQTGIAEDPATGGATGPLAAYMIEVGLLPGDRDVGFVSEQGVKMGRRSLLHVRVEQSGSERRIKIGGSAVVVARGTLFL